MQFWRRAVPKIGDGFLWLICVTFLGWTTCPKGYMVFQKVFTKLNESCMFTFDLEVIDGLHVRYTFYVGGSK